MVNTLSLFDYKLMYKKVCVSARFHRAPIFNVSRTRVIIFNARIVFKLALNIIVRKLCTIKSLLDEKLEATGCNVIIAF